MTNEDQILTVLNEILARQASHLRLYKFALAGVALLVASLDYVLLKVAGPYWSLM